VVLFIGILCFIVFLAEGAMLDWSAVFLTSVRGVDPSQAGLGYTAFATTMTIGRLMGDRIVQRLGNARIILFGGLLAGGGLALATLVPSWVAGIGGYALVGAGCSNIVPVLFTAVGRQKTMPEHVAVPAISTLGYAGILAGPAAIGFIAHATSLSLALLGLAGLLVAVALSGRFLRV
jgi:MFS family permease